MNLRPFRVGPGKPDLPVTLLAGQNHGKLDVVSLPDPFPAIRLRMSVVDDFRPQQKIVSITAKPYFCREIPRSFPEQMGGFR